MVRANCRRYVAEFREGRINPHSEIRQIMDAPSMAIFDGDGGAGYLVATQATEAVIEKAKSKWHCRCVYAQSRPCRQCGDLREAGTNTRFGDLFRGGGYRLEKTGRAPMQRYGMRCLPPRCVLAYQRLKIRLLYWT